MVKNCYKKSIECNANSIIRMNNHTEKENKNFDNFMNSVPVWFVIDVFNAMPDEILDMSVADAFYDKKKSKIFWDAFYAAGDRLYNDESESDDKNTPD